MDRACIGTTSGYLPPMYLLLRPSRSQRLLKDLSAVVWMHGSIAVSMKNNGRDEWCVRLGPLNTGAAALTHRDECRGKVSRCPTGEPRMYADCGVQVAVGCSHHNGRGRAGRQSSYVNACGIDRIVLHDLSGDARDQ